MSRPTIAFKVMPRADWIRARAEGIYDGSAVDLEDGYIHLSTQAQLNETLAKHYRGQPDLVVLSVDLKRLDDDDVVWEPSRGGDLFPHLYAVLPVVAITAERRIGVTDTGAIVELDR